VRRQERAGKCTGLMAGLGFVSGSSMFIIHGMNNRHEVLRIDVRAAGDVRPGLGPGRGAGAASAPIVAASLPRLVNGEVRLGQVGRRGREWAS
jgi:hypothetical protein